MTSMRWTLLAFFLAAMAANASCGRKGDPNPPAAAEESEDENKSDSGY